jgi:predicted TIM-barrel fold metal-dependent hydrolase
MADFSIIDAHHHFWDLEMGRHSWLCRTPQIPFRYGNYSEICQNYLIKDYQRDAAGLNVVKTVHMEAEWDESDPVGETRWLHKLHDATGYPNAIVGQAWFDRDDIAVVLDGHAAFPLVRSVRQKPKAALSPEKVVVGAPGSMGDPKFREGYSLLKRHGFHYDLQTPWWHLAEAARLAQDFPDTLIILNHTGLPSDRSDAGVNAWRAAMAVFAEQPNTAVKISGLGVPGQDWTVDRNRGVVVETIALFGVERCMFASNFPVDRICGGFASIFNGFKKIVTGFKPLDQAALFHNNAERIYRPI